MRNVIRIFKRLFCNHSYVVDFEEEYIDESNGNKWNHLNDVPLGLHVVHHTYKVETCFKCGKERITKLQ